MYLASTPQQPDYAFGQTQTPDITGFDPVRRVYISRDGHAWKVDNGTGLWYDMGIASDYYASLPPTGTSTGGTGYLAIIALIAALYFMG